MRREVKDYGLSQAVEGSFDPQEPTAILEDVVTTGDSIRRVIKVLEEFRSVQLELSDLCTVIPLLKPRLYSIASSCINNPQQVCLCIL